MSSNLLAVQELATDAEAVGVRELPVQATTFQTPVTLQATHAKVLPPTSILTTPPTGEAPSQRKRKRPRIRLVNYLEEDYRPSRRFRRLRKGHPYKYSQGEED